MSSPAQKGSEGSQSPPPAIPSAAVGVDSHDDNAPTAATAAIASMAAVSASPAVPFEHAPQEKTAPRRSQKKRHHQRKQSKVQPPAQRAISSVSSFSQPVTPASALGVGTHQDTSPADLGASTAASPSSPQNDTVMLKIVKVEKMKGGGCEQYAASSAVQSDDPSCAQVVRKTAVSTTPPKKRTVKQNAPTADPEFLKALASLTPSPDNEAARQESAKGSKALLGVGGEQPSSSDRFAGSHMFSPVKVSFEVKVVLIGLLTMATLAFLFLLYPRAEKQTGTYCKTQCCQEHQYRIENQLDKSVNPCDDFADYVCRRWTTRQKLLLSRSEMWDMLLSWLYKFPERLNKVFSRFPIAKKVIAMFNTCNNKQGGSQVHIMKEFMRARGIVWPEKAEEAVSPEKALFDLSLNWNVHLWFTLKIFPSISKEIPRLIFVEPNELMRRLKAVFSQIPRQTFHRVYKQLFRVFSNDTSSKPEPEDILKTFSVLERVFNILVPSRHYKPRITKLLSLSDMDYNSSFLIGSHLMNVLNSVAEFDPPITLNDLVLMEESSNIGKIFDLIADFGNEVVMRHLSWLFVLEYGTVAYPAAVMLIIRGSEDHVRQALPRYCARQVESSYKLLVAAMASVGLFSEQERRRIDEHLAAIVEEAANKTWAVSWLDNDTKKIAVEKLKSVRTVLWPSEKFLTPEALDEVYANFTYSASSFAEYWIETRRSERLMFGSQAAEEEMFLDDSTMLPYVDYRRVLNHLTVSMGALAPPLYCKDGTNAMFYGGLLYAYARELITAIDSDGVKVREL
ncbi:neprilysin-like [Dermacentor variabilis]|uniref:neprilysin-like n=1 Tax=Dermacentor variabilis TaxID=34621 RepID=UPI003F5C5969